MSIIRSPLGAGTRRDFLRILLFTLVLISLACSLPGRFVKPQPTSVPEIIPTSTPALPTPTPQPQPPALVEINPPPGAELPLDGPLTLYFNQPMQRASVEAALQVQPAMQADFTWQDDATLIFQPAAQLAPQSEVVFSLGTGALSAEGLALPQQVSLSYQTAGYLRLVQLLPDRDAQDVDPTSAVVASFNRPVVALGAEQDGLPAAFTIEPPAAGRTEWLNTSTYIFYPETGLEGGTTYRVSLNPELQGADGSPLETVDSWSFSTAMPRLVSQVPAPDQGDIRLDSVITLTFNQPMDPASMQANFALLGSDSAPVSGQFNWDSEFTSVGFIPDNLLERSTEYSLFVGGQAQARGGTPLGLDYQAVLRTVDRLAVLYSSPGPDETLLAYKSVQIYLNAPLKDSDVIKYITIEPEVADLNAWWDESNRSVNIYGSYAPVEFYTLRLSSDLVDPWGESLAEDYVMEFVTAPLAPSLLVGNGTDVLFLTPQDASLNAQVTNITDLPVATGSLPLVDFIAMISGQNAYEYRRNYRASDHFAWTQVLDLAANRSLPVDLNISPDREPKAPGLYYYKINAPQEWGYVGPYLLVVSHMQVTFKLSATDALVWAVDLRTQTPRANALVTLYDQNGAAMARGQTGADGVFQVNLDELKDPYSTYYAVLGEPGEEGFGLAISTWSQGIAGWDFGLPTDYTGPRLEAYLYTDRPIYRPGQTVYFRAVVRQAYNGRYQIPDLASLPLTLYRDYSDEIATFNQPISIFGTAHGEYTLPEDATPGYYRLASKESEYEITVNFQVAEYRKPEINLQVAFAAEQALAGDTLLASVNARYFFDAPAGNLPVEWSLYATPTSFYLPDYRVGSEDTRWLEPFWYPGFYDSLGMLVQQGSGLTDAQGLLNLELPAEASEDRKKYTLEVTAQDESGLPVSSRASIEVNPGEYFIGVRSDSWVSRAGEQAGFDILVVDWDKKPVGQRSLIADFEKIEWVREEPGPTELYNGPKFIPQITPVGSTNFQTNAQGEARLAFVPPDPGSYQLIVRGDNAVTQILLWVAGQGQTLWPELPNHRMHLVADQDAYRPGETARVFIPNPFEKPAQALVTVERSIVLRSQVLTLEPGGYTLEIPLSPEEAPNVFISVTLIGERADGLPSYRQGYIQLNVATDELALNVAITSQPERAGPGDEVAFDILVTDSAQKPVQAEFSIGVIDLAVLALADPNVPDILPAFYGEQPLGVRTGVALAVYGRERSYMLGGGGGGGGGDMQATVVRERFPDTAFWQADVVTDADGRARVTVSLPDNLTTWQIIVRSVTQDTRVGQAELELVSTKDLLVRPVAPRFLVVGDHVQLAAVVQNNTSDFLQVQTSLQASGFELDDPAAASQSVSVPGGGRARVEWWGVAQDVSNVDLVFSATAQEAGQAYQDAARPALGDLPVLRYTASQTYRTSGILEGGGQQLELVSLPRSFDPDSGGLHVELSSSLAGTVMSALDVLEHYPYECIEQTLSRFLPNLEVYLALQQVGIESPSLQARLNRTLDVGLNQIISRQNQDGGWGWWQGGASDPLTTAYVVYGLGRARQAGITAGDSAVDRAVEYLFGTLYTTSMAADTWQLDRLAFTHFAIAQIGPVDVKGLMDLYKIRDQLSPWAQAFLVLTLEMQDPRSEMARTLLSDLSAKAIRSSTGAHWEPAAPGWQNMNDTLSTTAIVLYALAQRDPASPLVADTVRYLVAHRQADGAWHSTYSTAWSLMALAEVMKATGELQGDFAFSADLNGAPLANGQAGGEGAPVTADVPISGLYAGYPNALTIQRDPGQGRLYYTAALDVSRPVEEVTPLAKGISIARVYLPAGESCAEAGCTSITEAAPGELVKVRVMVTLEQDAYYLLVEDYLPAGTEILDTSLKTSQQWEQEGELEPLYNVRRPYASGWGWWLFSNPRIYDDRIAWAADYMPAGTYELTYTLVVLQAGEYRVLPARAWQFYFPEVQGNSAGAIFTIKQK